MIKLSSLSLLLTIVFFVLQINHVIEWPWVWVFSPLWISAIIVALVLIFCMIYLAIMGARDED